MTAKTAELRTRLILGSSMLAAIAALYFADLHAGFGTKGLGSAVLLGLLGVGGILEYVAMRRHAGHGVAVEALVGVTIATCVLLPWGSQAVAQPHGVWVFGSLVALTGLLLLLTSLRALRSAERMAHGLEEQGAVLLGFVLIAWPLALAQVLALMHLEALLFVVLVAKGGDIGAYLVGIWIGRRKLIPHVSPGKTIEGALGGLATSILLALVLPGLLFPPEFPVGTAGIAGLGVALNLTALIGDLVESQLKRRCGVKDSSRLLPAHGGILDLVDSLLFTIPTYWLFLFLI